MNDIYTVILEDATFDIRIAPKSEIAMSYDEAVMYCFLFTHDGHKDWRLPTRSEYHGCQWIDGDTWYLGEDQLDGDENWYVAPIRIVKE